MQTSWRKSIWSKVIAAGFIVMICLGNIWFVASLSGEGTPVWLQLLFGLTLLWIFIGAVGLGVFCLLNRKNPEQIV